MDTVLLHKPAPKSLKHPVNLNRVILDQVLPHFPNAHKTHQPRLFNEFVPVAGYNVLLELKHDETKDDHQRLKYS